MGSWGRVLGEKENVNEIRIRSSFGNRRYDSSEYARIKVFDSKGIVKSLIIISELYVFQEFVRFVEVREELHELKKHPKSKKIRLLQNLSSKFVGSWGRVLRAKKSVREIRIRSRIGSC